MRAAIAIGLLASLSCMACTLGNGAETDDQVGDPAENEPIPGSDSDTGSQDTEQAWTATAREFMEGQCAGCHRPDSPPVDAANCPTQHECPSQFICIIECYAVTPLDVLDIGEMIERGFLVPGDAEASPLLQQSTGGHHGITATAEESAALVQSIETFDARPVDASFAAANAFLAEKCLSCHDTATEENLLVDVSSYDSIMNNTVISRDALGSRLYEQAALGIRLGLTDVSEAQVDSLRRWIVYGASR